MMMLLKESVKVDLEARQINFKELTDAIDIAKFTVSPGEIIVWRYDIAELDVNEAENIHRMLCQYFSPYNKVIAIPKPT